MSTVPQHDSAIAMAEVGPRVLISVRISSIIRIIGAIPTAAAM
jgi:hypothetical protein